MIIQVTSLKQLKNNKYEVTFSTDEKIVCTEELVLKYRLVKNKEIKIGSYNEIFNDVSLYDYYEKALKYLSRGLKSKCKIYYYLVEKECSKDNAKKIVELLEEKKLLNDLEYFLEVSDYYIRKGYGTFYIEAKAKEEMIDSTIIANVLSTKLDEDYLEYSVPIAMKQLRNYQKLDAKAQHDKLFKYLYQRGYTNSIINRTLKEVF